MKKKSFKKKFISLSAALSVSVCAVTLPVMAGWQQIGCMGDLNNDSEVNIADLLLLSKHILNKLSLTSDNSYYINHSYYSIDGSDPDDSLEYLHTADINQDGKIDVFDLIMMRKYVINKSGDPVYKWSDDDSTTTSSSTSTTTTTTSTSSAQNSETTSSTTAVTSEFIEAPVRDLYGSLPSQENAEMVIFYVDFPDCKYQYDPSAEEIEKIAFGNENAEDKNYPFESISAFYNRSSKGSMKLDGKVFRYTTKENKSAYEGDIYHVNLINEVFQAFENSEDFTQFDSNGDKIIDAALISVPTEAGSENWWPAAGQYGGTNDLKVDGMSVGHVIVGNAQIESKTDYKNFNSSYLHEIGHCMGLPDYYLYTNEKDFEGLHGSAGYELMDEANSDFSAVSKLMLGWFRRSQIEVYDSSTGTQTFTLTNAQTENGNCVIIPYGKLEDNYYSEFFVIEYTTLDINNSSLKKDFWWKSTGSGIRVLHVNGEINDNYGWKYWKYASGENTATNNDEGKRFVRIIDDTDTDNLYHTGDVIDSSISGFNWYDSDGNQSVDPKIKITVGEQDGESYTITISEK
ncbi:MAG: hypothetical protein K2I06_04930 [Ruminococcus sp.]|nr:hypothetical protein [Ruminococcus sp.]